MLELQHRLIRQTINIAVSKAMEDMKSNTRRSIRNLIDLGLLFSTSENQKWFFNTAKKVISNPQNPYNALAARMIADVDNDTIKKVGLNLGYNSLTYGANKLRKRQEAMDRPFPWLLVFDISESHPDFFHQIEKLIREGQELGIYSYIFCLHEANDIADLCGIVKQFDECLFVFKAPSALITDQTAASLRGIHNAVVCVQALDGDLKSESCVNAFRILKQNRCLYGFHLTYNEDNMEKVTAPEYIRSAIALGILFGMYIADAGVSSLCQDALYAFACSERGEKGQPLITLEWLSDMRHVSGKILSGCGYMVISSAGNACCVFKKVKYAFENSLLEMLQGMQPCTSS
ncbi:MULTISPECIES: hypothetical protein [unclassified Dehalobacter]|uniref:hypothetical protein n=1 Tax=unclassified Dehalobacter TaxID=2635733 RepID=UPI000E6BA958|nr:MULTISPECIES: hypothetical protein [unclassified Dehalobacter]RJE46661.1 hypothetical protein A7K50_12950 [Dehalobacter sp. MCB1]TCX47428.1 hypothetical protein C1I36_14120 [Dehalobacter sp. 14DCB1]TCX55641.1 hypothetical protein C1I38_03085 [Dehalobacter sp. 12DCB1]